MTIRRTLYLSAFSITLSLLSAISYANTPPQDAHAFFSAPDTLSARISPDSLHIALVKLEGENRRLETFNTQTKATQTLLDLSEFAKEEAYISDVEWIDNHSIALHFAEKIAGVKGLADTKTRSYVFIVDLPKKPGAKPTVKSIRTAGELISSAETLDNTLLYAINRNHSALYRINTKKLHPHKKKLNKLMKRDGGQFKVKNRIADVNGYALRWFVEQDKSVAVTYVSSDAKDFDKKKGMPLIFARINDDGSPTEITRWSIDEHDKKALWVLPFFTGSTPNQFYGYNVNAEHRRTVYRVTYHTDDTTEPAHEPTHEKVLEVHSGEIINVIAHHQTGEIIGVRVLDGGRVQEIYQQADGEQHVEDNEQLYTVLGGTAADEQHELTLLYYVEDHQNPGQYWFVRGEKKYRVASAIPQLNDVLRAEQFIDSLDVTLTTEAQNTAENATETNTLTIPYLLSTPQKTDTNQPAFPLIVIPHGGPIGPYDDPYFNRETQYFVANGYAVLRVNFRGSGGYSDALFEAGKKQWGSGMLSDIEQVTRHVIKRDDIDAQHLCIYGASYGGYAATMLTIKQPDLFNCGVNYAGVSDLPLWLRRTDTNNTQLEWTDEQFGHSEKDFEQLNAWSSINHVAELSKPLLIIHGEKDDTVDIEHAWRLRQLLDKHQKTYAWKTYSDMGHSIDFDQNTVDKYQRILAFINQHI